MKKLKEQENRNTKGITLIVLILIIVALIVVVGVIVTLVVQLNKNNTEISNNETSSQNIINAENDNSESEKTEKKERKNATVPEGFYHVEGTTEEEGFVISDVEGDDLNNTAGGNQYVWIPVDGILGEDGTIDDVKDGCPKKAKAFIPNFSYPSTNFKSVVKFNVSNINPKTIINFPILAI